MNKKDPFIYTIPQTGTYKVKCGDAETFEVFIYDLPQGYTPVTTKCDHSWKEYNGFTESYKYCIKCDIRKGKV